MSARTKPAWMSREHEIFQDTTRKFFAAELTPNIERWRAQGMVDRAFWPKAAEFGLLGATAPEEWGGAGADRGYDVIIAYEQTRAGDTGWGWSVHNICLHYILAYGTAEQQARWVPRLISGEIIPAIAMTEPGTGSDLQSIQTTAIQDGSDYRLSGSKIFVSNGQSANLIIVAAKTDPQARARGISLIGVETDATGGFSRGRNLAKIGMKGQDTSELFFDQVRVPRANLLGGQEGRGFSQLMSQLAWERLVIGVLAVGAMDAMLAETLTHVRQRKAFDQRLMDFQNSRFKLAEAKTKLEVTRSFIDDCVARLLAGNLDAPTASMAKWWGSQMQCEVADECLQLFGGYGYMLEYPIAHFYADARVQKIFGGTNEIQKELIARSLDT
ncbi:MAG: acyl-CoA dehydrogenase family protein [Proteobacteria bacterium]|nr:acyl-CoA dehydrogenase family protein [Pseudomonadota bacterium]